MATVRHIGLFPLEQPNGTACWTYDPQTIAQSTNPDLQWFSPTFTAQANRNSLSALFWRVRTFRFTNSLNDIAVDASVKIYTSVAGGGTELVTPLNERDLVCAVGGLEWRAEADSGDIVLNEPYRGGAFYLKWEGGYTGPIFVQIHAYDGLIEELPPYFTKRTFDVKGAALTTQQAECGSVFVRFHNVELSLPLFGTLQQPQGTSNPLDVSVSATVEAVDYWPYNPGDGGGPIYNSATGAQIRPFPF